MVTYSIEDGPHMATAPLFPTPSRWSAGGCAIDQGVELRERQVRSPSITARWPGRSCACARIRSGMVAKGLSSSCAAVVMDTISLAGKGWNAAFAEGGAAFLEIRAVKAGVDRALGVCAKSRV